MARARGGVYTTVEASFARGRTGIAPIATALDGIPESWTAFDPGNGPIFFPRGQARFRLPSVNDHPLSPTPNI